MMIRSKECVLKKKIKKQKERKLALLKKKKKKKMHGVPPRKVTVDQQNIFFVHSPEATDEEVPKNQPVECIGLEGQSVPGIPPKRKKLIERCEASNRDLEPEPPVEGNRSQVDPIQGTSRMSKILTQAEFSYLKDVISKETLQAVSDMGFTKMTEIQVRSIPPLLDRRNLVGNAKTGSGKTLAFLIPAIERIAKINFKPTNGTGCLIITPTRELALQIHGVLEGLLKYHPYSYGLIMGGASRETEVKHLQKGINILVATPGRLLDHLKHTPRFLISNLKCLIIDEADRILEIGFEEDLKEIIRVLPEKRQTMLFSATNTKRTEDLARLAIKKEPVYVEVLDCVDKATVDGLVQGYVICPSEKRFLLLCTFLHKTQKKKRKVMVFFSSCLSVKYHDMIFNSIDLPVMSIHGKKKQRSRTSTFFKFCEAESGILLCTDVAARGLDIPAVDWIIQYDPPDDPKEYIHRVGRTARGEGGSGRALLFLRPEEEGFLSCLKESKIPLEKYEFDWDKLLNIQQKLENMVSSDYDLRESAKEGFVACVRSYLVHHMKEVFDIRKLDLAKLAKTFGLPKPPPVNLNVNFQKLEKKLKKKSNPLLS